MASQIDLAWAAGFHEGEGHIALKKTGGVIATVSQCNPEPLMKLKDLFGGSVYGPKTIKSGNQDVWVWQMTNASGTRKYFYSILPWLSEKKISQGLGKIELHASRKELKREFCSQGHQKTENGRGTKCRTCDLARRRVKYWREKYDGEEGN